MVVSREGCFSIDSEKVISKTNRPVSLSPTADPVNERVKRPALFGAIRVRSQAASLSTSLLVVGSSRAGARPGSGCQWLLLLALRAAPWHGRHSGSLSPLSQ